MDRIGGNLTLPMAPFFCKFCQLAFPDFDRYHKHTKRHNRRYLKHWLNSRGHRTRVRRRRTILEDAQRQYEQQQWFMYTNGKVKIRNLNTNNHLDESSPHFECKVCNRAFSAAIHLIRHERQAHNRQYVSPADASTASSSTDGSSANQAEGSAGQEEKRKFCCEYCGKRHHNKSDLDYHKRSHTGETLTYTCEICKSTFKRKVYLNRHMRIHNDIRPYVCKICGKSFIKGGGLKEHERTHTGEKPYKCPTCQRGFSGRANLRRHEMTHSGEQPFECKICSKRCNRVASLRQHMRIHTGERPYNCMHCNKSFPTCANLRRHERTHLERKQFHCRQCGKEFTQKYTLKLHEMNHLGIRPHLCLMCGKTFIEKRKLRQHLQMVHGVAQDADESSDAASSEPYALDLALEGNKHLDLSNLRPFAGSDFEESHFKTIEDFQTYWKTAYQSEDSRTPKMPKTPAEDAVETSNKLQEVLSRISQNSNTQNNPAKVMPRVDQIAQITTAAHVGYHQTNPVEASSPIGGAQIHVTPMITDATPVGYQPDLPTLTMTNSGLQIVKPGLTTGEAANIPIDMTTASSTSKAPPKRVSFSRPLPEPSADPEELKIIKEAMNTSVPPPKRVSYSRPPPEPSTDPEELKIIRKAMKKAKKEAKKEAKKKAKKDAKKRAMWEATHAVDLNLPMLKTENGSDSSIRSPALDHGADQPMLAVPQFITSNNQTSSTSFSDINREHNDSTRLEDYSLISHKESENVSGDNHQHNPGLVQNQPIKSQNGNFIFNRYSNMLGSHSCDQCGQTFTSDIVLDIHKRTHAPEEHTSFCIVCSKSFSNADLEEHIKTHSNEIPTSPSNATTPKSMEQFTAMMAMNMPNDYIPPLSEISPLTGEKYPVMISASPGQVSQTRTRKIHSCPECGKQYVKKSSLVQHMKTHEVGIVPVECVANMDNMWNNQEVKPNNDVLSTCATSKTTDGKINIDNAGPLNLTEQQNVKCPTCFEVFSTKDALATHMEKHNETLLIQAYADNADNQSVDDEMDDDNSSSEAADDPSTHPWACLICGATFPRQERLAGHMNKHKQHKLLVATMTEARAEMEKVNKGDKATRAQHEWQCPYCEKKVPRKSALVEHLRDHVGVHPYTCEICNKGFYKKANWTSHQVCHSDVLSHECEKCSKKFKHAQSLKKHLDRCRTLYKCDDCGNEFRHKRSLNSHVWNTHVRIENCRCKICGKVMSSASGLREHEMAHTGEKPYICETCGRGFGNRSNLRRHVMIHDNSRPFVCTFCKMTFNRLASLQQHERCHTGEKPYKCSICEQYFTSKSTRRKHEKRHTQKREVPCTFCGKKFWDKYTCKVHERTHTGELPFACKLCAKKFPERNVLARHMKKSHQDWCAMNSEDNVDNNGNDYHSSDEEDSDNEERKMQPLSDEDEDDEDFHMSSETEPEDGEVEEGEIVLEEQEQDDSSDNERGVEEEGEVEDGEGVEALEQDDDIDNEMEVEEEGEVEDGEGVEEQEQDDQIDNDKGVAEEEGDGRDENSDDKDGD